MAKYFIDAIQNADLSKFEDLLGNVSFSTGVSHGKQCLQLTKTGGAQLSVAYTPAGTSEDYEITVLLRLEVNASNQRLGAGGHLVNGAATGYGGHPISDDIIITRHDAGVRSNLANSYINRVNPAAEWTWVRFRKDGNSFKCKVWPERMSEPTTWDLDTTDPSALLPTGKLGLFAFGWGTTDFVAALGIATNGETAPKYKSDIVVRRGSATIAAESNTATLTAGVDYVAPDNTNHAYLRVTGAFSNSGGAEGGDFNGALNEHGIVYANPGSLGTELIFERNLSAGTDAVTLTYEIIEYVGDAGGANEFIVRHNEALTFASGVDSTIDSAAITGIINPSDCIPFLNGAKTSDNGRGETEQLLATAEVFADKVTLNRQHSEQADTHSLTLVEFVGSNYTVQRVEHAYSGTALETETVSVADYTKTALYLQQRGDNLIRGSESGENIYLSDNTTLNFDKYAVGVQTSVVWMLENPYFRINEYSGTITGSGTATPTSGTLAISQIVDTHAASLMSVQGQLNRNSEDADHALLSMTLTDTTTVSWSKGFGQYDINYRFQVLEWPINVAVGEKYAFSFGASSNFRWAEYDDYVQIIDAENTPLAYPQAYDHSHAVGTSAGFTNTPLGGGRDRAYAPDPRLATLWQALNTSATPEICRVALPKAGRYRVRLAGGDAGYTKTVNLKVKDGSETRIDISNVATLSNQAVDATGAVLSYADWTASNQAEIVYFGSGIANIESGGVSGSGNSALNYIEFEYLDDGFGVKQGTTHYRKLDGDFWSGSNFYNETTIDIAPNTNCLAVRAGGSIGNIADITIGGVSLVLGASQTDGNSSRVDFYYLMNPATGSLTLRIDGSSSSFQRSLTINELSNVDVNATPTFDSIAGYVTQRTTTVNGGDGAFIASAMSYQDTASASYDQTSGNQEFADRAIRTGYEWANYSQLQVGAGDVTISATQDLARFGAIITGAFAYAAPNGLIAVSRSLETSWNIESDASTVPWTPSEITTLAWYDADDATTITESSGQVAQWDDKSGSGLHATQSVSNLQKPVTGIATLNGKNVLNFDKNFSQHLLTNTTAILNGRSSIGAIVVFWNDSASISEGAIYATASGGGDAGLLTRIDVAGFGGSGTNVYKSAVETADSTNQMETSSNAVFVGSQQILMRRWEQGVGSEFRIDGETDPHTYNSSTLTSVTSNMASLKIGTGNTGNINGNIAELIIFDGLSTDIEKLEGYLAHKWGLAANLPVGHTYKSAAPTVPNSGSITVNNSLGSVWSILNSASATIAATWSIAQTVQKEVAAHWAINSAVAGQVQTNWQTLNAAANSAQFVWALDGALGAVTASTSIKYNVLQQVIQSESFDWSTLNAAGSSVQLAYNIVQKALNNIGVEWSIRKQVNRAEQITWDLGGALGIVKNSAAFGWQLRNQVQAMFAAEWDIFNKAGASVAFDWALAQEVKKQVVANWDLLNQANGSLTINWSSVEAINGVASISWNIETEQLIVPFHTMLITAENRAMTVAAEARTMNVLH